MADYSVGQCVTLQQLSSEQYNDLGGVVQTALNAETGRHQVYVYSLEKTMALKLVNLCKGSYPDAATLSVKQLLHVLKGKAVAPSAYHGMERADLAQLAAEHVAPAELGKLLLPSAAPAPVATSTSGPMPTSAQMKQQADMLKGMTPAQMRSQAAQMRSSDPNTLRRTNPQMAHLTDAQIKQAADEMEQLADNPELRQMAIDQMDNMSPEDMQAQMKMAQDMHPEQREQMSRMRASAATGNPEDAARAASQMSPSQLEAMVDMVRTNPQGFKRMVKSNPMMRRMASGMTDEQMDKQLDMLTTMDPSTIRRILKFSQTLQKVSAPVLKVYTAVDKRTFGTLKYFLLLLTLYLVYWFLSSIYRWLFGASAPVPMPPLEEMAKAAHKATSAALPDEDFLEDEF